nr:hypothetical protein [Tanacetum cinerariifolium]
MDTTIDQHVAMDEALVPHAHRLRIERSNFRLLSDIKSKESTLQLVYHVLCLTPFFKAFLVEHKDTKKSNEMYYPRFMKVIIHHFMSKDPSIPRRNKVNWHYVRDDHMFTTIKLVSRHQNTQQFGAMLLIELTNEDIRNSNAYKEYYAGKQAAKASKAKSLYALSEVAMTEVQQLKLATKRSLQQTHISQASATGADEGTDSIPGVPDVTLTPVNPNCQQQSSSVSSQFVTTPSTLLQDLPNFGSLFGFDHRLKTLEANFSEFVQKNQFDGAVSFIPGIVHGYMDQQMNEAVKVAVQLQSDRLCEEAQKENHEFHKTIDENMQKIIKEQVKEQVKSLASESAPVEEPMQTTFEMEEPSHPEFEIVDTLTAKLLAGPTYELIKGSCKSLVKLEFFLEEVYKATTDQLDWVNPEGASSRMYTTSVTKTKAADYEHQSVHDVYSKHRIIAVTELKIVEWHNYKHLDWIMVRRDDDKLYKFKEGNFKRLRIQDIEDMLLLLVQGKLTNLTVEERFAFNVSLRMFTRSIVIQRRVEDLQLGVKSYQKKLNLTKPNTYRFDLKCKEAYIAYSNPRGFIYQNRLMRIDELHKFSDGTLTDVCTVLDDRLKGIQIKYLPQSIWRKSDKDRAAAMIQAIDKRLKTRRIMRSLERFVGGRLLRQTCPLGNLPLGGKRQQFYGFAVNRESVHDVYSKHRIIAVTELKIVEWHNYKHLDWITVRRDDDKLYKFKEGNFKRLRIQDIKDMLLLLVQGKLTNLTVEERFAFNVSLRMFTRSIIIQRRVEDLQLGVESYQKKLNLTKPNTYHSDLKRNEAYIAYSNPRGFIYQNRLMRIDELHKFSDGTLTDVCTALDDRLKGIQIKYLPQSIWRKSDKDRAAAMFQAIDKRLKTRRIMRSLERFVGGRLYEGEFRMLQRTI